MKTTQIGILGLALLLAACNATTTDLQKTVESVAPPVVSKAIAPKEFTPEEERDIGRNAAAVLLGAANLVQNPDAQKFVNDLGTWIAEQSARPDLPWRFGIINSRNINAFATPGGHILITRGLMLKLNDESELAGVLAHEIAHVVKRHYVIAAAKSERANAIGDIAAKVVSAKVGNSDVVPALANLGKGLYASGLDKGDEYEADRLAVVYVARAGYDPYGLPRVLRMYSDSAASGGLELLFATHPMPEDRVEKLGEAMGEKLASFESGSRGPASFKKLQATLAY